MKHADKLKKRWEFRRLYTRGKCLVTPAFVLYYGKGKAGRVRLGITAGKKLGIAVKRNRAKRVITAAFDRCMPEIKKGFDFVLVARSEILCMKSTDAAEILYAELSKNGLIDL